MLWCCVYFYYTALLNIARNQVLCNSDLYKFQKYFMYSLFIAYENDEWGHFVLRIAIGSQPLISYYCVSYISFYFFLFS